MGTSDYKGDSIVLTEKQYAYYKEIIRRVKSFGLFEINPVCRVRFKSQHILYIKCIPQKMDTNDFRVEMYQCNLQRNRVRYMKKFSQVIKEIKEPKEYRNHPWGFYVDEFLDGGLSKKLVTSEWWKSGCGEYLQHAAPKGSSVPISP
jgi:hypothetical protein